MRRRRPLRPRPNRCPLAFRAFPVYYMAYSRRVYVCVRVCI